MPYVQRDQGGAMIGVFANPQPGFAEESVPADDAALVAFLAAASAFPTPKPTPRQWLDRLSADKQDAIWTAAAANPALLGLVIYAAGGPYVDVTDAKTIEGVGALVAAGVLTSDDQATLLAP